MRTVKGSRGWGWRRNNLPQANFTEPGGGIILFEKETDHPPHELYITKLK